MLRRDLLKASHSQPPRLAATIPSFFPLFLPAHRARVSSIFPKAFEFFLPDSQCVGFHGHPVDVASENSFPPLRSRVRQRIAGLHMRESRNPLRKMTGQTTYAPLLRGGVGGGSLIRGGILSRSLSEICDEAQGTKDTRHGLSSGIQSTFLSRML